VPLAGITIELGGEQIDTGAERAGLVLLAAMLLSFAFIRFSARMIRAEVSWWPGNVTPGGLHIHHLVFGIVLLLLAGFLGFALQPESPWLEILAALFGIGAGLTLDEFALWLYLEDVYWAEEGRNSVDAMIIAMIIAGGFIVGFVPLDAGEGDSIVAVLVTVLINLLICAVVALKGKLIAAVVGMCIPPVAWVTAIRLAQPDSFWAKRRYAEGSRKLARSRARKERHDRRRRRFQELVGGTPSLPRTRKAAGQEPRD
jgi:hypothetical protein